MAACTEHGLVSLEGMSAYDPELFVLSLYEEVRTQTGEWTKIYFLPTVLPTIAVQSLFNFEVFHGTDSEWPKLVQTFVILRSNFVPLMAVTAPVTAGTWTRTGEKEVKMPQDWQQAFFVIFQVIYEDLTSALTSSEVSPITGAVFPVVVTKVANGTAGTAIQADGTFAEVKAINTDWAIKTVRSRVGLAIPNDGVGVALHPEIISSRESFYWPAVLQGVIFNHAEFYGTTASQGTPTNYSKWAIQARIINAYHGLTKVLINNYVSRSPFTNITAESLHPTHVHWELAGENGHGGVSEPCLTSGVTTPEVKAATWDGTTYVVTSIVISPQRTIDATPQTSWIDHIFIDEVTYKDGLYWRHTEKAIVPTHAPGES